MERCLLVSPESAAPSSPALWGGRLARERAGGEGSELLGLSQEWESRTSPTHGPWVLCQPVGAVDVGKQPSGMEARNGSGGEARSEFTAKDHHGELCNQRSHPFALKLEAVDGGRWVVDSWEAYFWKTIKCVSVHLIPNRSSDKANLDEASLERNRIQFPF